MYFNTIPQICNASAIQHVLPEEDFGDVADVGEMGGDLTECVRQASVLQWVFPEN